MTAAYTAQVWGAFFLAAAGSAAALSGLIFVGLAVTIKTVQAADQREGRNLLAGRVLEAAAALLIVLVISLVGLVPGIPRGALAAFILVAGAGSAVLPVRALAARRDGTGLDAPRALRLITGAGLTVTVLLAGVTLATGHGGGLYWLPAAFVLAVVIAAINAWALLAEVLR